VVHFDTTLGQQLLEIPVGEAVTQVPADRDRDHLWREPESGKRRPLDGRTGNSRSMRGLKRLRSASVIAAGHAFVQNLRRGHYEPAADALAQLRLVIAFTEHALAV
jgi:hypothetical protein